MVAVALAFLVTAACVMEAAEPAVDEPLFPGLGHHHHPITTKVPLAQRYFDQGLTLAWAFNHGEAERSFQAAAALDPGCAMCYWGEALVLGPNINMPMQADAYAPAYAAIEKAQELASRASPREQVYIAALAKRYGPAPVKDRSAFDKAYAEAMHGVMEADLDDLDAKVLFAEAAMDTTPWDYWLPDGRPKPVTEEILNALDAVLARQPDHIGANHLYIHTVEAMHPRWAIAEATRLASLAPGAGHLVHMPAHIWIRVGRLEDARIANERSIAADQAYMKETRPSGAYKVGYMPHNHHFLWEVALLQGNQKIALAQSQYLTDHADPKLMRQPDYAWLQAFSVAPLFTDVAFARWSGILASPEPAKDLLYPRIVWHYARAVALARTGEPDEAERDLAAVDRLARDPGLAEMALGSNSAAAVAPIAAAVARGEVAAAKGDFDGALAALHDAVKLEDGLTYDEPPPWPLPTRHDLGAVLLAAGRSAEAETVFREDLARFPGNGWSLYGLTKSLAAEGKTAAAGEVRPQFQDAWKYADVDIDKVFGR
jgi:tetratricopeptide (TPR) repeat protein